MNCPEQERTLAWLLGDVVEGDPALHAARCPTCQRLAADTERVLARATAAPRPRAQPARRWPWVLAAAAGLLLLPWAREPAEVEVSAPIYAETSVEASLLELTLDVDLLAEELVREEG